MKKVLILLFVVFAINAANAQKLNKGDLDFNLGFGFLDPIQDTNFDMAFPSLTLSGEYCAFDRVFDDKSQIGIGGFLGYSAYKWDYNLANIVTENRYSNFLIGAQGVFHYNFTQKVDTYAGSWTGLSIYNHKWTSGNTTTKADPQTHLIVWTLFAGAHYYFTDAFGVFAELGIGGDYSTPFRLGLTFKL